MTYKEKVIGRAGVWVAGLEFVRDESFSIVEKIATAELGGSPAAGGIAGGGSAIVKSAAGELGKYLVGTSKGGGDAVKNIALDGERWGLISMVGCRISLPVRITANWARHGARSCSESSRKERPRSCWRTSLIIRAAKW